MATRGIIVQQLEDGSIQVGSDSEEGFYPGEIPAMLEEAAKQVARIELQNHWGAMEQKIRADAAKPDLWTPS